MKTIKRGNLIAMLCLAFMMAFQLNPGGIIHGSAAQTKSAAALLGAGELDPTFGDGGLVTTDMNRNSDGTAVATQPDGRLIVAGRVAASTDLSTFVSHDFALSRYNPDGSLDATFGTGGLVTTDFANMDDAAFAVALQTDAKIIAAGRSYGSPGVGCTLARYDIDGTLDLSFGTDGKVTVILSGDCFNMALQSDDKIIVVGTIRNDIIENNNGFWVARLNSDGSPDTTFGENGIARTFADDYFFMGYSVVLQPDNAIVVAGSSYFKLGEPQLALARYTSDGSLDTSFGTRGVVITSFENGSLSNAVAIQKDDKIITVGIARINGGSKFGLMRFHNDGSLDTTFGANGQVITEFDGSESYARSILLQTGEKIVVTGESARNFAMARYNPDGSLDSTFGIGGKGITDFGGNETGNKGALLPNGKIVMVGTTSNPLNDNMALACYGPDGSPDPEFGTDGKVITKFSGSFDFAYAIALQPDGKSVLAGSSSGGSVILFSLSRHNIDGSIDETFGTNGKVLNQMDNKSSRAYAMVIQPDAKIVVAGGTFGNAAAYYDMVLARYTSDGSLDPTFGAAGVVITDFAGAQDSANAVALQPDGKIIAAGWTRVMTDAGAANYSFALARYENNGSLDTTFGSGGQVVTDFVGLTDMANAIVLQPDHKIVVAGISWRELSASGADFGLARYNEDGTLDGTFGTNGTVTTDFGSTDIARALTMDEEGKIIVAGDSDGNSILVRYNSDGSLDPSFGNGGEAVGSHDRIGKVLPKSAGNDHGRAVVMQSNGKFIVGGDSNKDFALLRYNRDGSLDATFGTGGKITTDFGASDNECYGLALQPGGKVLAAGFTNINNNYDFAAARYLTVSLPKKIYLPLVFHLSP